MKLSTVFEMQAKIREEQSLLEQLKLISTSITSRLDGMPGGKSATSRVESLSVKILDSERHIDDLVTEMTNAQVALSIEILSKVTGKAAEILILRYVHCRQFREIAAQMHYGIRNVFRLHSKGLKQFEDGDGATESKSQPA